MEISSLSANAYASQSVQSERSQQTRQAQQVDQQSQAAKEQVEKKDDAPKPVANAQGQTTGQVISVTA